MTPPAIGTRPGHYLVTLGLPRVVRIAGIGQVRRSHRNLGHGHHRYPEVVVRVHGQTQPEGFAYLRQMLHLPESSPVMVIAKNHLNGIEPDCLRQVAEGGHGYVTGKGSIDAFREEGFRTSLIPSSPEVGSSR